MASGCIFREALIWVGYNPELKSGFSAKVYVVTLTGRTLHCSWGPANLNERRITSKWTQETEPRRYATRAEAHCQVRAIIRAKLAEGGYKKVAPGISVKLAPVKKKSRK